MRTRILTFAGISLWVVAVAGALIALSHYKNRPGPAAIAPSQWPAASILEPKPGVPTLVMLAHPRCPCTRASLAELAKLTARLGPRASTRVLFIRPEGVDVEKWENSDLLAQARAIDGVEVVIDRGAVEAARFGSATSGQTLLYDASGALQFAGGITLSRGHEGDSPGAERIASLVTRGTAELAEAPVFGCALGEEKEKR